MTTKEKLHSILVSNGMFPAQATTVLDLAIPEIESLTPNYKITWDRPSDEYPR